MHWTERHQTSLTCLFCAVEQPSDNKARIKIGNKCLCIASSMSGVSLDNPGRGTARHLYTGVINLIASAVETIC